LNNTVEILDELKGIECPVDEVVSRVVGVLEKHQPNGSYQILAREDEDFIHDGIKVYNAYADTTEDPSIEIVVEEGMDNYVAKIIDANLIEPEVDEH
jgi:hypothetical protein